MKVEASADLAMALPLPVKPGSGEKAVTFINPGSYKTEMRGELPNRDTFVELES
jgi:hypothetical protein